MKTISPEAVEAAINVLRQHGYVGYHDGVGDTYIAVREALSAAFKVGSSICGIQDGCDNRARCLADDECHYTGSPLNGRDPRSEIRLKTAPVYTPAIHALVLAMAERLSDDGTIKEKLMEIHGA